MKNIFKISEIQHLPSFSPPYHGKTINRKLIDEAAGARHFTLWHGEVEPGGGAEAHMHDDMEQVIIILEGEFLVKIGDEEHRIGKDTIAFFPAKQVHQSTVVGDKTLKLLIFSAPPPASDEAWKKQ